MQMFVWFVRKDTGLPDNSLPKKSVETVGKAIELIRAHKAGANGNDHYLKVFAGSGQLSSSDHAKLLAAGAEVSDEFLQSGKGRPTPNGFPPPSIESKWPSAIVVAQIRLQSRSGRSL